ncbi:hypothetical protein H0H87_011039 [Tephrocybe sp. NHM501043]|nr:hypothetical protein H0H87_011039 [Tephrocybe sp. NHM501043]
MVGRFATLAKQTPSPSSRHSPYDNTPVIVAETTTTRTEVVTTTTTTHFFSLPLWRKRGPLSSSSSRHSTSDPGVDKHGINSPSARSSFYMVEKDLPPTPTEQPATLGSQILIHGHSSENVSRSNSEALMRCRPPTHGDDVQSFPTKQSATILAHAALGVGLPHTLSRATPSSSSSPSEINTITFSQSAFSSHPSAPQPRLRKSKSSQKLKNVPLEKDFVGDDEHRRSRGISFSGSALLNIRKNDEQGRYEEQKEHMDRPSTSSSFHVSPKGLARRTSFWSRKKMHPPDSPGPPLILPSTPQASRLLTLPPVSPFDMNITVTPSSPSSNPNQKKTHTRGLSRSRSARSPLRSTPLELEPTSFKPKDIPDVPQSSSVKSLTAVLLTPRPIDTVQDINEDEANTPKRRQRAQTNPPLLNRLSLGWLSPSSASIPPLQRLSNDTPVYPRPHTRPSAFASPSWGRQNQSQLSPDSSSSSRSSGLSLERRTPGVVPLPTGDENPLSYLRRLQTAVSKAEIAGILASSPDDLYNQALQTYIGEFEFVDDPLDVALRKLLMEVGLPRETQQIDRVMEAFANRYLQCNPALFMSDDHPYILAFSLIMLHTDAFNKSNKRKMSKPDYIKNTRLPGIFSEVLDCFYDNIVFAPFIFIEDPLDIIAQPGTNREDSTQSIVTNSQTTSSPVTPSTRATKVDPYYLITNNLLGPLRIDIRATIPMENPFSYEGTAGPWEEARLRQMFAKAYRIEVSAPPDTGRISPFFSKGVIGGLASPPGNSGLMNPIPSAPIGDVWTLKLTKVGILHRKDDVLEGGKKAANRKWKPWSVFLTGSQLLFFRDPSWATSFHPSSLDGHSLKFQSALFRPDELLSLRGAIAMFDKSYTRYDNTLRLLLSDRRQLLLQAPDEKELNEWIATINYASAFKTAGVRIRPLEMSRTDVKLTGVAAATSHLHDLQSHTAKSHIWNGDAPHDLMGMLSDNPNVVQRPNLKGKLTIVTNTYDMDLEVPTAPEVDGADQFKATFDQVKADLAAGCSVPSDDGEPSALPRDTSLRTFPPSATSAASLHSHASHFPSRLSIVRSKVDELELRITAAQSQLDTNMRLVQNIAVLTPFQKSTRDRLIIAVQDVAQRIMQVRLEITRLTCHRDILINDIASEERSWHRAKTIALQAATETLQNRRETVPRMTLSQPRANTIDLPLTAESPLFPHLSGSSPIRRSVSSICESFHSAMDFGPDWPTSADATSSFLGTSHLFDSPTHSSTPSVNSYSTCDGNVESPRRNSALQSSPRPSSDFSAHEKFYTASEATDEQAEDWNQTRCAQRVSLVKVPSDIQLKPRFGRYKTGGVL